VRELRNVIERAIVLERGPEVGMRSLMLDCSPAAEAMRGPGAGNDSCSAALPAGIVPLEEMEREMVSRAMRATGDNQTRAAELLGLTRDQLRYRLKKLGLAGPEGEEAAV
jgi:DNA-binding NtrC family response regulator